MKKDITLGFALFLLTAVGLDSCKKSSNDASPAPLSLYVVGYSSAPNGITASYWKNGQRFGLPTSTGAGNAFSIMLSGSDVYIAGVTSLIGPSKNFLATYWKNGEAVTLPDSNENTVGAAIALLGSDIYVGGYRNPTTAYGLQPSAVSWKNGSATGITYPLTDTSGEVTSIAVSGSDIYLGGYDYSTLLRAVYWKNGSPVSFPDPGAINAIAVSGSDVYAAGMINSRGNTGGFDAAYWKNGVLTDLGSGQANAITISGTDVYIAGFLYLASQQVATYWKNGTAINLQKGQAFGIAVNGSDVYTAGNSWGPTNNGSLTATYWKNLTPVYLNDGYSLSAIAIGK